MILDRITQLRRRWMYNHAGPRRSSKLRLVPPAEVLASIERAGLRLAASGQVVRLVDRRP